MLVDELLAQSAGSHPDKTAIACAGERWSYFQVEDAANRFAGALVETGLHRGDRVAICLENSVAAIVSLFGVLKAGGVFLIVNPHSRVDHARFLLRDSGATVLVARADIAHALFDAGPLPSSPHTVFVVGRQTSGGWDSGKSVLQLGAALASARCGCSPPAVRRSDRDLAALVYTSGSTGESKGVMLTHRNMTAAAAAICAYLENTNDDVILSALPLAFTYGLGQVTTTFRSGARLVLERSFLYPGSIVETLRREQVTGFPLVPTMATLLLQQSLKPGSSPHLRYITSAAAALPKAKMQGLRTMFPSARLYSMYGLTECQRATYLPPDQIDTRPGSVGVAIPGTAAFVVDEHGARAPAGVVGELVVAGPHVMAGYWNRPAATRAALRQAPAGETVLYTGDLFHTDCEGFLYFVARKDDVIKTGGHKVAPRYVEEVIALLPAVAEVAVFGVEDDVLGEAVAAAVAADRGSLTPELVRRHCLQHLEAFMVPKTVDIRDSLPATLNGKISRRMLRADTAGTAK